MAAAPVGKRESDWMPNTRKILVVDDDSEFRDALTEQLGLMRSLKLSRRRMAARACRLPKRDRSIW